MKTTSAFKLVTATAVAALSVATAAFSADPESCSTVHLSDIGWTDVTSTTATASLLLKKLGYEADIKVLSLPVTYTSMKNKDIDVFLGNWMQSQKGDIQPYLDDKSVESYGPNLVGAKYTLATNAKGAELGIKDFKDIAAHKDDLDGKIYGIEPGNDGNRHVIDMIDKDTFGMKAMELVESSEQGMLAQVARAEKEGKPIVFLGNWMPTQEKDVRPYIEDKSVESFGPNLVGAKYTLATNAKGAELGIKDFKDVAAHKDDLDGKIYGIEPGNDGNRLIMDMIEKNTFGMKDMEVVESSEQGMLAQVARSDKAGKPVVFLGWEPHPMNTNFKLTYLTGGDDIFGPDFGGAKVYTNVRAGYLDECPNVGAMLKNLTFSLDMENHIMGKILNDGKEPEAAASEWLKANPSAIEPWLAGVKTRDGKGDALAAAKTGLGL